MKYTLLILSLVSLWAVSSMAQSVEPIRDSIVIETPDSIQAESRKIPEKLVIKSEKEYSDEFLDTVKINNKISINDYTMIGVQYGMSLSQTMFNPTKKQGMVTMPMNIGVVLTRYGKLFGYMPYFGFQTGFFYGQSGYKFKKDKTTGEYTENVDGAYQATYSYAEIPLLAHFHVDVWHLKLIANAGLFGAYRLNVSREGDVPGAYLNDFYDYERRFEYGVKAGLGIGVFFDPIEIHFEATYRQSLGSLYKPDYYSQYYYRFAYPSDIVFSVGLHVQLTKRTGKTRTQLRKEAKEAVYEPRIENIDSQSR